MTMNSDEARRTIESLNAVGSPVERHVRPLAWMVRQGARTYYVSDAEFVRSSYDTGSFTPLYGSDALAQLGGLAEDRLQQMKADRAQALRWRDQLDRALTVCRCAARVVDSSAYQGVSDEDCDLEDAVRNWRALGPNVRANRPAEAGGVSPGCENGEAIAARA